jgi:uncharacterized membrane protein
VRGQVLHELLVDVVEDPVARGVRDGELADDLASSQDGYGEQRPDRGCTPGSPTPAAWPLMSSSRAVLRVVIGTASSPTTRGICAGNRCRGASYTKWLDSVADPGLSSISAL